MTSTSGLLALVDFEKSQLYNGESGRLYRGSDIPPQLHYLVGDNRAQNLAALSGFGMIALGYSICDQIFQAFSTLAAADNTVNSGITYLNGAQWGLSIEEMLSGVKYNDYWDNHVSGILTTAGIASGDVRVAWIHTSHIQPAAYHVTQFPQHSDTFANELQLLILDEIKIRFPNIQICLFNSPIYSGYALNSVLEEPFSYETSFGIKRLIQKQVDLNSDLIYFDDNPWLDWGIYMWANGTDTWSRYPAFGLAWEQSDFGVDGVHLSAAGQLKAGNAMISWFKAHPIHKVWFLE